MEKFNVTAFLAYVLICAYTPGPNNILSMSAAGKYGFKRTLPLLGGIFTGFVIVMLLCAYFSVALAAVVPKVLPVMKWIGAAYILWLAWHIWKDTGKETPKEAKPTECRFITGFMLEFVNVKIMLYGVTSLTSFVMPAFKDTATVVAFAVLLAVIGSSSNITWALCGEVFDRFFRHHQKQLNAVMALLLAYCAAGLLL
ncbi:MAG: cysteine/O-acetylserine transporter [Cloacibacillus sp.]